MEHFTSKTFTVPTLIGISAKNIEEHLKLYAGYVKHTNLILEKITEYTKDAETNAYVLGELQRRFSFEFDGMRNHEYYFASLESGPQTINTESALYKKITEQFGSYDAWLMRFKAIALTRGIGWAILYYDAQTDKLLNTWVEEQHLGHLTGLTPILALDVWEHAYVADYHPSGKKQYVEDFFTNLNWSVIEKNFEK
ncbi:superoxide dismutase [Candidatus Nomurabacteria bacterium]|nr:superoxide dismutase [Candidatus Nomurabacteria bacterium]